MQRASSDEYFRGSATADLGDTAAAIIDALRQCITKLRPAYLLPEGTRVAVDKQGSTIITLEHRDQPDIWVKLTVFDDDEGMDLVCPALHPTFGLQFGDSSMLDAIGDWRDAAEITCGILAGRVESYLRVADDGLIVASEDVLIRPDGDRITLYRQYRRGGGLLQKLLGKPREVRRVSFSEPQGTGNAQDG